MKKKYYFDRRPIFVIVKNKNNDTITYKTCTKLNKIEEKVITK